MKSEIRSLTGLRGVAALLVVASHYYGGFRPGAASGFVHLSGFMVDLFFVLSGFIMSKIYGERFLQTFGRADYWDFLLKRFGRTYPLYIVLTVTFSIAEALSLAHGKPPSAREMIINLALVQTWGFSASIIGPAWSISTEWAAYFLFPWLARGFLAKRKLVVIFLFLAAVFSLFFLYSRPEAERWLALGMVMTDTDQLGSHVEKMFIPWHLIRCIAEFCFGIVAYRLAGQRFWYRWSDWLADSAAIAIIVSLCLKISPVYTALLYIPLIIGLATGKGLTARFLSLQPVYWLGLVSYSIYLVHIPVEDVLRIPLQRILEELQITHSYSLSFLVTAAGVLIISALTFRLIEEPARRKIRGFAHLKVTPIETEPNAP